MAITASLKRSCLDDAWDAAKVLSPLTPDLRAQLRANEKAARAVIAGGSYKSISANRRLSEMSDYGPGQLTLVETVELWRFLIDTFDSSKKWLTDCATYGLDPAMAELDGFPFPPPAPVSTPTAVVDSDVYAWMMDHIISITELRNDYQGMRVNAGAQFV